MNNPSSTVIRGLPRSEHRPSNHVVHEGLFQAKSEY